MKIDATCIDRNGVTAVVSVDLDYVQDTDGLRHWIEEELYGWSLMNKENFDTWDFVVSNWDDIIKEIEDIYGPCD